MTPFYIYDAADKEAPSRGRVQFLAASSERSAIRLWATFTSLDTRVDLRIVGWAKCSCEGCCACPGWVPTGEQIAEAFAPIQDLRSLVAVSGVMTIADKRSARQ